MSSPVEHVRARVPRWLSGRYIGLTIVLLVLSVSSIAIGQTDPRKVIDGITFTAVLVLAIRIVGQRLRVATVAPVVPTLISHWIDQLIDSPLHRIVGLGLATVFLAFLTLVIMFAVFRDETVTFDTIFGAVCAYLLLGVTWGTAYALLVVISPDSLSVSPGLAHASGWGEPISAFTPVLQLHHLGHPRLWRRVASQPGGTGSVGDGGAGRPAVPGRARRPPGGDSHGEGAQAVTFNLPMPDPRNLVGRPRHVAKPRTS
jgi:voltage-gated potassium channel